MALALRGGAAVVSALSAYVLFQVWQRMDYQQRRRILRAIMSAEPELQQFRSGPLFLNRIEKHLFVTELFSSDPGGPIVITGPQGSGKTMIVKRALSTRPQTVYLDLRAQPASSGTELSMAFVQQCGYLLPPNELLGRAIFTRDAVGSATLAVELDRALKLIAEVLRADKANGWVVQSNDGTMNVVPPVLCIDELNTSDASALTDDPAFWRFIDWTLFLTDNRLAHVVFTTSLDVADSLDANPGFRSRRQKVHLDFPRPSSVHRYFNDTLNPFLGGVLGATPRPQRQLATPPAATEAIPPVAVVASVQSEGTGDRPVIEATPAVAQIPVRMSWLKRLLFGAPESMSMAQSGANGSMALAQPSVAAAEPLISATLRGTSGGTMEETTSAVFTISPSKVGQALSASSTDEPVGAVPHVLANKPAADVHMSPAAPASVSVGTGMETKERPEGGLAAGSNPIPTLHVADGQGPSLIVLVAKAKAQAEQQAQANAQVQPQSIPAVQPAQPALVAQAGSGTEILVPGTVAEAPSASSAPAPAEPQVELSEDGSLVLFPAPPPPTPLPEQQQVLVLLDPAVQGGGAIGSSASGPSSATTASSDVVADNAVVTVAVSPSTLPLSEPAVGGTSAPRTAVMTSAPMPAVAVAVSQPTASSSTSQQVSLGSGPFLLEQWEIERIVDTIGGHLKDLDMVVTAIVTGKSWAAALERLVADSVEQVERHLEQLLVIGPEVAAGGGSGSSDRPAPSALRRTAVPRSRLLTAAARNGQPMPSWDYQLNPRADRLASYSRYLRAWSLITELASRKYIGKRELSDRIFAGCAHEMEYFADAGLVLSVNVRAATRVVIVAGEAGAAPGQQTQQVSLPGTYVTASSPRMRQAFRSLLGDPNLQAAATRARAALAVAQLREEEGRLLKCLPEVVSERAYWQSALTSLVVRDTALRTSVAKELVAMMAAAPTTGLDFLVTGSLSPPAGAQEQSLGPLGSDESGGVVPLPPLAEGQGQAENPVSVSTGRQEEAGMGLGAPFPASATQAVTPGPTITIHATPPPETSLLGVRTLQSTIDLASASLKAAEGDVKAVRVRLSEVRAALDAAEANAEIALPGSIEALSRLGIDTRLLAPGPLRVPRPLSAQRTRAQQAGVSVLGTAPSGSPSSDAQGPQGMGPQVGAMLASAGGDGGQVLGFEFTALTPTPAGDPYAYGRLTASIGMAQAQPSAASFQAATPSVPVPTVRGSAAVTPYWRTSLIGRPRRYQGRDPLPTRDGHDLAEDSQASSPSAHSRDSSSQDSLATYAEGEGATNSTISGTNRGNGNGNGFLNRASARGRDVLLERDTKAMVESEQPVEEGRKKLWPSPFRWWL